MVSLVVSVASSVVSVFMSAAMVCSCSVSRAMPLDGKVAALAETGVAGIFSCLRRSCWARMVVQATSLGAAAFGVEED